MTARVEGVLLLREYPDNPDAASEATFYCPGCEQAHTVTYGPPGTQTWTWDGNAEMPTFYPSVLSNGIRGNSSEEWNRAHPRCHLYVTAGRINYLTDSEHALAGQTVDVVPLPERWHRFAD